MLSHHLSLFEIGCARVDPFSESLFSVVPITSKTTTSIIAAPLSFVSGGCCVLLQFENSQGTLLSTHKT